MREYKEVMYKVNMSLLVCQTSVVHYLAGILSPDFGALFTINGHTVEELTKLSTGLFIDIGNYLENSKN